MYYDLTDRLAAAGYEHYEISNWAKTPQPANPPTRQLINSSTHQLINSSTRQLIPSYRSRHNSGYWNQTPYLGLGAAAHSFDGQGRQWNVADVKKYMEGVERGQLLYEREELDGDTRYNDIVMTALRTREGLAIHTLSPAQQRYCLQSARQFIATGLLVYDGGCLRLSREGLFVSDMIMAELMKV
jgi:oxygen-independent coproporphyrinogen-3 oxidase